jgi:hypothetical protein
MERVCIPVKKNGNNEDFHVMISYLHENILTEKLVNTVLNKAVAA